MIPTTTLNKPDFAQVAAALDVGEKIVLIVDDRADNARLYQRAFSPCTSKYSIVHVKTAAAGIECIRLLQHLLWIVVLDLKLGHDDFGTNLLVDWRCYLSTREDYYPRNLDHVFFISSEPDGSKVLMKFGLQLGLMGVQFHEIERVDCTDTIPRVLNGELLGKIAPRK